MYKKTCSLLVLMLCGCSLLRSYNERTFSFNYAGSEYEIISKVQGDEVLENLLLLYNEEGEIILKGIDKDSDGELDELQTGDIGLSEANRIYYVGIEQALESGNLDSKNELRLFETTHPPYVYSIETFGYEDHASRRGLVYGYMKEVNVYNVLKIIHMEEESEKIFRDVNADGKLDATDDGETFNYNEYQQIYKELLDEALEQNRMAVRGEMYIVLPPSL